MCDATFTLGQRGSHFFQCPSRRDYTRLPTKLQRLLASNQINRVYHVTLGFDDSFLITYQGKDGRDHIESYGLPEELTAFLYATNAQNIPTRLIPRLRLTLGPNNDSFFAGDGSAYLWLNLPPKLLTALQSRIRDGQWTDKPRIVALGADQNFLLITDDSKSVWNLPNYWALHQMLEFSRTQVHGIREIRQVVLHAYRYQGFIAHNSNGNLICQNLPDWSLTALDSMRGPLIRDAREEDVRSRQRNLQIRPSLRERADSGLREQATFKREWSNTEDEIRAKGRGLRLSLSLSIGTGGFKKLWK